MSISFVLLYYLIHESVLDLFFFFLPGAGLSILYIEPGRSFPLSLFPLYLMYYSLDMDGKLCGYGGNSGDFLVSMYVVVLSIEHQKPGFWSGYLER